ncbi:rhomboid family intramembrane serine protease [Pontibacter sp. HJ8]
MVPAPVGKAPPDVAEESDRFAYSFLPGTLFVGLIWLISLLVYLSGSDLTWLGVLPRHFFGLIGIFTGPLIHAGLIHLLSNSFPLVLLSGFILFLHRPVAVQVFTFVYLVSGLFTWFMGREAYHVGASGVVYGLAGYLLFNGLLRRDRAGLAVALAILFLYGGLFYGLFPVEERISWEGHLGGLLAGMVAALLYGERAARTNEEEAEETGEAIPAPTLVQQQHQSSSLGNSPYTIRYTLGTNHKNTTYEHSYRLNPTSGMVEAPTKPPAFASTEKKSIRP